MLDPYLVLGVGRYDDDQKVKKAYRALSKQYHPDNNINNPNKTGIKYSAAFSIPPFPPLIITKALIKIQIMLQNNC